MTIETVENDLRRLSDAVGQLAKCVADLTEVLYPQITPDTEAAEELRSIGTDARVIANTYR